MQGLMSAIVRIFAPVQPHYEYDGFDIESVMEDFRSNGSDSPYDENSDASSCYSSGTCHSVPESYISVYSELPRKVPTLEDDNGGHWIKEEVGSIKLEDQYGAIPGNTWIQQPIKKYQSQISIGKANGKKRECSFCMNNGESYAYYSTHSLHDSRGLISCPILYRYICPICGATGSHSHTRNYCPLNHKKDKVPMMNVLRTMRSATGRVRKPRIDDSYRC